MWDGANISELIPDKLYQINGGQYTKKEIIKILSDKLGYTVNFEGIQALAMLIFTVNMQEDEGK